jgi:putative radical SAM enzyme (TIGR03279 family)
VDQLPRGMRRSLRVKDDDWRHSFLMGTYVTLTNLSEEDIQRILRRKTSPLYVSVHATDEAVRRQLLGNPKAPALMPLLGRLTENGIRLHTQIVVCPGINDKEVLERTVRDLFALCPGVASVAVVPVGLTRHRARLKPVTPVSSENAEDMLSGIHKMQKEFLHESGTRFVFAADELYIRAGKALPGFEEYEDFTQIENGVGLVAKFIDEIDQGITDFDALNYRAVSVATGEDFAPFMKKIAKRLHRIYNINIHVYPIKNDFFGREVTVTGLLTGRDIVSQLKGRDLGEKVFLSGSVFREFTDVTLDDMPIGEIEKQVGVPFEAAPPDGYEWIAMLAKERK